MVYEVSGILLPREIANQRKEGSQATAINFTGNDAGEDAGDMIRLQRRRMGMS